MTSLGQTPYKESMESQTDVTIRPVLDNGSINYITISDNDNKKDEIVVNEPPSYMFSPILLKTNNNDNNDNNEKKDIFSIDDNMITKFYVGSITVVGLYILFRLLNKNK